MSLCGSADFLLPQESKGDTQLQTQSHITMLLCFSSNSLQNSLYQRPSDIVRVLLRGANRGLPRSGRLERPHCTITPPAPARRFRKVVLAGGCQPSPGGQPRFQPEQSLCLCAGCK